MQLCFKKIKESIPLKTVADGYGLKFKSVGEELIGPCPLHGGDNPTAFHLNPKKNRWTCFTSCGFGDVIDFVSQIEKCTLRKAAEILVSKFSFDVVPSVHPYLVKRNFDKETLNFFGVTYQQGGAWHGMITLPLHDGKGTFVGYLGRRVINLERGKYKVQKGLKLSELLFNLHRVDLCKNLFVVEGPFDAIRMHQAGYPNVVSLLGRNLSDFQYGILKDCPIILVLDQDPAGLLAAKKIKKRLCNATTLSLPAKDPGAMTIEEIQGTLKAIK